jgi:hypothetical protein
MNAKPAQSGLTLAANTEGGQTMSSPENKTKVTILTGALRIRGHIDLLAGARVTDFIAEARDFIVLTDVEVWDLSADGRRILKAPFINVNRSHIQVVSPGH